MEGRDWWLTQTSAAYCSGFSHYRVRRAIVERLFGVKCDLTQIAEDCDAHRNTAGNHNKAVRLWIEGDKKTGERGVEGLAWSVIERRFDEIGLLRSSEVA